MLKIEKQYILLGIYATFCADIYSTNYNAKNVVFFIVIENQMHKSPKLLLELSNTNTSSIEWNVNWQFVIGQLQINLHFIGFLQ